MNDSIASQMAQTSENVLNNRFSFILLNFFPTLYRRKNTFRS